MSNTTPKSLEQAYSCSSKYVDMSLAGAKIEGKGTRVSHKQAGAPVWSLNASTGSSMKCRINHTTIIGDNHTMYICNCAQLSKSVLVGYGHTTSGCSEGELLLGGSNNCTRSVLKVACYGSHLGNIVIGGSGVKASNDSYGRYGGSVVIGAKNVEADGSVIIGDIPSSCFRHVTYMAHASANHTVSTHIDNSIIIGGVCNNICNRDNIIIGGRYNSACSGGTVLGGYRNIAVGQSSFVVGECNCATVTRSTALGVCNHATCDGAIAIGVASTASNYSAMALGYHSSASGSYSTALGCGNAEGRYSVAIGGGHTTGCYSVAAGRGYASGGTSFAASHGCSSGTSSTALSRGAATNCYATAVSGGQAKGKFSFAAACGCAVSDCGVALGDRSLSSAYYTTAVGNRACATECYSNAFGYNVCATGKHSTGVGHTVRVTGCCSVAVGQGVNVCTHYSVGLGFDVDNCSGCANVIVGTYSSTVGAYNTVVGTGNRVCTRYGGDAWSNLVVGKYHYVSACCNPVCNSSIVGGYGGCINSRNGTVSHSSMIGVDYSCVTAGHQVHLWGGSRTKINVPNKNSDSERNVVHVLGGCNVTVCSPNTRFAIGSDRYCGFSLPDEGGNKGIALHFSHDGVLSTNRFKGDGSALTGIAIADETQRFLRKEAVIDIPTKDHSNTGAVSVTRAKSHTSEDNTVAVYDESVGNYSGEATLDTDFITVTDTTTVSAETAEDFTVNTRFWNVRDSMSISEDAKGKDIAYSIVPVDSHTTVLPNRYKITDIEFDKFTKYQILDDEFYGMYVSEDGMHMAGVHYEGKTVYKWSMGTRYNMTTVSGIQTFDATDYGNVYDVELSSDGTKMYLSVKDDNILQFTLSTAWDITTATYDDIATADINVKFFSILSNGTKLVMSNSDNMLEIRTLTTAWDLTEVSDAITTSTTSIGSADFTISKDGKTVAGTSSGVLTLWSLGSAFGVDVMTPIGSLDLEEGVAEIENNPNGLVFSPDGLGVFVCPYGDGTVYSFPIQAKEGTAGGTKAYLDGFIRSASRQVTTVADYSTLTSTGVMTDIQDIIAITTVDGIMLVDSGYRMYIVGDGKIFQFHLPTAYKIDSAVFAGEFSLPSGTITGVVVSEDGTKAVLSENARSLSTLSLSVPFDISTAVRVARQGYANIVSSNVVGISANTTGTRFLVRMAGKVTLVLPGAAWDPVLGSTGIGSSFSLPVDIIDAWLDDNGDRLITTSNTGFVTVYTLATQWDLATAGKAAVFDISSEVPSPISLFTTNNGKKTYVMDVTGKIKVFNNTIKYYANIWEPQSEYWLDVTTDLTNITANVVDTATNANGNRHPQSWFFNSDGTIVYFNTDKSWDDSSARPLLAYNVPTPYDVTSIESIDVDNPDAVYDFKPDDSRANAAAMNSDGTVLFLGSYGDNDDINAKVTKYTLSTAWDITTLEATSTVFDLGTANALHCRGLRFSPDGTKMYVHARGGALEQYTLSTAWDITTAGDKVTEAFTGHNYTQSFDFSVDGTHLIVEASGLSGTTDDGCALYSLPTAWDITGMVEVGKTLPTIPSNISGVYFDSPEQILVYIDSRKFIKISLKEPHNRQEEWIEVEASSRTEAISKAYDLSEYNGMTSEEFIKNLQELPVTDKLGIAVTLRTDDADVKPEFRGVTFTHTDKDSYVPATYGTDYEYEFINGDTLRFKALESGTYSIRVS